MSLLNWSSSLDIGVNEMNNQHKILLGIMNDLFDYKNEKEGDFEGIKKYLLELGAFTVKHFEDEEAYMEKIGFSGLETHKLIHKDLLAKFTKHKDQFLETRELSEDFFGFLKFWLKSHIMGIDIKYGNYKSTETGKGNFA